MPKPFDISLLHPGDIVAYRHDNGFVGDNIYKEQRKRGFSEEDARYTHVEVYGGRGYAVRVAPPHTQVVKMDEFYKGRYVKCLRLNELIKIERKIKTGPKETLEGAMIAFWASSNCNKKYDWYQVLAFKLPILTVVPFLAKITSTDNLFFCSENALWAEQKEFIETVAGLDPKKCMPAHLLMPEWHTLITEGVIQ
jgi:hypothetical protein